MSKLSMVSELSEIIAKGFSCPEKPACEEGTCPDCFALDIYSKGYRRVPQAQWKHAGKGLMYCSLCAAEFSGAEEYNFCPNCGADMR